MNKSRLEAFTDGVLAIIITILVLELEKPAHLTFQGFLDLWPNYFAYAISFFWIGAMWINMHNNWYEVKKITTGTLWATLIMLFCSSLFPYVTSIVSANFYNKTAEVVYGLVVLAITFSNSNMYASIAKANGTSFGHWIKHQHRSWAFIDIAIKILGLIIAATVYPPAMIYSVMITLLVLVIPNQIKRMSGELK